MKNLLHIELSKIFQKSRDPAEVVTTDKWNFASITPDTITILYHIFNLFASLNIKIFKKFCYVTIDVRLKVEKEKVIAFC